MPAFSIYFKNIFTKVVQKKLLLLQVAIIISVILVSIAVAYINPSQILLLLIIAVTAGIIGVSMIMQWPSLGLILTILGGFFVHFSGPSNINIVVLGILALVALWLAKLFVVDRKIELVSSSTTLPILVFIILAIISFGIGLLPLVPYARPAPLDVQVGGLVIFILSAGAFLFVANTINLRWLEWLTWIFIIVGGLYICGRLLSSFGIRIGRLFDPGLTTGSMFWTWLVALTFSQAFLNKRLHPILRALISILVILILYIAVIISNDWKSGWVPPLAAIAAIVAAKFWRPSILLAPFGIVAGGILAYYLISTDTYSWGTRVDAWLIVLEITKASPIFGLGFANYYWYSLYFPIRGYFVPFNSHSQYIDILAQTGILGLLSFFWIFLTVGRLGWQLRDKAPEGFPQAYIYGVIGGVVGTLVAASLVDWVLPFAYNIGLSGFRASVLPWVFMGGLVCIEQLVKNQTGSENKTKNKQRSYA